METTAKQRIMQFISKAGISIREFERASGLSNGYVKSLRKSPTTDKMQSIIRAFPELNPEWLMTGNGDMVNVQENHEDKQDMVSESNSIPYTAIPAWADTFINLLTDQVKQNEELHRELRESIVEVKALSDVLRETIKQLKRK